MHKSKNTPNYKLTLTNEQVVDVIHRGNVTYTDIGNVWIQLLHQKWNVDAIVCTGECQKHLVFAEVKKGFFHRTKKVPEKFVKSIQLSVFYREHPDADPALWKQHEAEMGKALHGMLTERNIFPEFAQFLFCTPDEMEYWHLRQYGNDRYDILREKLKNLDVPVDSNVQYSIRFESFDKLAMWHIYAGTRGAVEFHLKKKFAGRVGVKVYGPPEGHYVVLDSKEFLDDLEANTAEYEQTLQEIKQITMQKDLWGSMELCGYRAVFCTWDSLTPEQHFHLLRD